jgi:hypothetical protein
MQAGFTAPLEPNKPTLNNSDKLAAAMQALISANQRRPLMKMGTPTLFMAGAFYLTGGVLVASVIYDTISLYIASGIAGFVLYNALLWYREHEAQYTTYMISTMLGLLKEFAPLTYKIKDTQTNTIYEVTVNGQETKDPQSNPVYPTQG